MNIGQRIKARRTELEMSMEQLAAKLGVNRSTIHRYETGAIEKMPISVIKPIAHALQTTPAYIMGWDSSEIDAVSEMITNVTEYDLSVENDMKSFYEEIGEMHLDADELKQVQFYARAVKEQSKGYGAAIKNARESKGMTQEELAEALGVDVELVKKFETNQEQPFDYLRKLYDVIGLTYYSLIGFQVSKYYQMIYDLKLTEEELSDVYKYAQFLQSKSK